MSARTPLGRRLPLSTSRFARVEELYELSAEQRETTAVWIGGEDRYGSWISVASLLDPATVTSGSRASLHHVPSHLVVIVRDDW